MRRLRGTHVALAIALLLAGCVPVSPAGTVDPIGTEVAIRVAVDATLTALAPRPQEIAFQSHRDGNGEIYLMDADGSRQRNLTRRPADDRLPAWSPDGERLAFASDRDPAGLYVMKADGTGQELVRAFDLPVQEVLWSPDGGRLAVVLGEFWEYTEALWLVRPNGSDATRVAQEWKWAGEPTWSPDGARLAFTVYDTVARRLGVADVDDGSTRVIAQMTGDITSPAWSPDGELIAFVAGDSEDGCPYLIRPDGQGLEALGCPDEAGVRALAWYPDGTQLLAFVVFRQSRPQMIGRVGLLGGEYAILATCGGTERRAAWSPDGDRLATVCSSAAGDGIVVLRRDGSEYASPTASSASDRRPVWRPRQSAPKEER